MIGRALRLSHNKSEALLLDCVGVRADLGFPTAPIRPTEDKSTNSTKPHCRACDSDKLYRTIKDNKPYKVRAVCSHSEEAIREVGYECEACGLIHGDGVSFTTESNKLYLDCGCGTKTLISKATSQDKLRVIFDTDLIEIIKKRVIDLYCKWLIDNKGAMFLYGEVVQHQIKEISIFTDDTLNELQT